MLSLEIVGNYVRFALATTEVAPDFAHYLRLIPRTLPAQSIAFDILIEQFIRVDLRTIAGEKNNLSRSSFSFTQFFTLRERWTG